MRELAGIPVGTLSTVLLVALGVVLGAVMVLGLRDRVFVKLGLRNGLRRRARTVVIVLGLMLGTAIITTALSTGDTMSRTIRSSVVAAYGSTDEVVAKRTAEPTVAVTFGRSSDLGYFSQREFDRVGDRLDGGELTDGLAPAISEAAAAQNVTRRKTEPRLVLFAVDPEHLDAFGEFVGLRGRPVSLDSLGSGEVYLDEEAAERLGAEAGDELVVYVGGRLIEATVRDVVGFEGTGTDRGAVLLDLDAAQELLGREGQINEILVSNSGDAIEGADVTDEVRQLLRPVLRPAGLEARPVKADGLDLADAQGDAFMTLFSTFGTFTIAAGILLIFLIFVMLAAERRSEMGTARAVGMQRRHLVEVFVFEGLAYDLIAAAVGTALGITIAYGMIEGVARAFDPSREGIDIVHGLSTESVVIAYALGVLLTFVVVTLSAWRVSVLNIVTAVRDLPEPPRRARGRRRLAVTVAVILFGGALAAAGASSAQANPLLVGVSLVVIGAVAIARSLGVSDRVSYTAGGLAIVGWWLIPMSWLRSMVPGLALDFSVWITGGLFLVLGATWTIMHNADLISRVGTTVLGRARGLTPVLRTSLAYPLRNRFRTGMTLALFMLVVFTLVVGAATSDAFNRALDDEANFSGGFEVRAEVAPTGTSSDLVEAIAQSPDLDARDFRVVAGQSFVPVEARQPGAGAPDFADYPLRGFDDAFLRATTYGLGARARGYGSDLAVWEAMRTTEGLAVVDSFVVPRRDHFIVGPLPDFRLRGFLLEDETFDPIPVDVRDPSTGDTFRVTVIGVLKDTAPLAMAGISTSQRTLASFGDRALPSAYYFSLARGVDPDATARTLESAFWSSGMQAESLREVLDDTVSASRTVQQIVLGFLALGLVIGVAGLGVVSARSVVERRQQIGVMRAIGFQRRMVQLSFVIESSLIAVVAIAVGTILGVVSAYNIVADSATQPSWSNITFTLPWAMFGLVFAGVYAAALVATFVPARQASRIAPASALRYQ